VRRSAALADGRKVLLAVQSGYREFTVFHDHPN
jgi:hypothetical protein